MKLSAVILAMTTTEELFMMTSNCINSLLESERDIDIEIIVVESNKNYINSGFEYPDFVKVIVPDFDFNFHKFLNIGIKESKGDYIALCNNDLIFCKNWFSEILKISESDGSILSFSPAKEFNVNYFSSYEIGYKVRTHIMGWCIVVNKKLFEKISFLDETFDFYYADNDYAMTLKSQNIKHAVVFNSKVEHLGKQSSDKKGSDLKNQVSFLTKYKIPDYVFTKEYGWVLEDEKNLSGFLKYHSKWGSPNFLYKKNKLADFLSKYNLGCLNRYIL